jgi:hypothetical protein
MAGTDGGGKEITFIPRSYLIRRSLPTPGSVTMPPQFMDGHQLVVKT